MALQLLAANNAQSVLAAGISASATSLTLNTGTGALFPSPVSGVSFFKLTLIDAATGQLSEIVHVTAKSGDVLTIVRGQEGTSSRAWSANDIAANMLTAGTISLLAPLDSPALTGTPTVPTASPGTSTTQAASTAFVTNAITAATGRLINIQVFYNSGIYNPTPGTKKVIVEMVGGGGGSAGSRAAASGNISVGGAGGAGSYAKGQFTQNFSGVQITVGTKGAGGTSSGPYASDGGTSSFGSLISAAGGAAGQPAGPTSSFPFSTVAAAVSAGDNGANIIGTPGQGASASIAVSAAVVIESTGGSSQFGAGGFITAFNAKGVNGSGYGSGGGPSKVNGGNAAVAGGDGSQGLVIVWEYA